MDHYKETFEAWNKVAGLYQDKFMDLDLYDESYDLFCNSIKKNEASVLDIGCGPGNITRYLLAKQPDMQITGIDIASNMIELAKKNNPRANFSVMDCRQISSLNAEYDGIICGFCLPYLSQADSKKMISDTFKLLTEQGVLYLSFVEGDPDMSGFKVGSSGDRSYFYYHQLEELTYDLLHAGFKEPLVSKVNYEKSDEKSEIHTILIAKK